MIEEIIAAAKSFGASTPEQEAKYVTSRINDMRQQAAGKLQAAVENNGKYEELASRNQTEGQQLMDDMRTLRGEAIMYFNAHARSSDGELSREYDSATLIVGSATAFAR